MKGERTLTAYRLGSATGDLRHVSIIYLKSFLVNILQYAFAEKDRGIAISRIRIDLLSDRY